MNLRVGCVQTGEWGRWVGARRLGCSDASAAKKPLLLVCWKRENVVVIVDKTWNLLNLYVGRDAAVGTGNLQCSIGMRL